MHPIHVKVTLFKLLYAGLSRGKRVPLFSAIVHWLFIVSARRHRSNLLAFHVARTARNMRNIAVSYSSFEISTFYASVGATRAQNLIRSNSITSRNTIPAWPNRMTEQAPGSHIIAPTIVTSRVSHVKLGPKKASISPVGRFKIYHSSPSNASSIRPRSAS